LTIAFSQVDSLLGRTKKFAITHEIFYGNELLYTILGTDKEVDNFVEIFKQLSMEEIESLMNIHQKKYLDKISPYIYQALRMKFAKSLATIDFTDEFKDTLLQDLKSKYPDVGKGNFHYLDRAKNVELITTKF